MSYLITQAEVANATSLMGAKARTLAQVALECGHVPAFVGVSTAVVEKIWQMEEEERTLCILEIVSELKELFPETELFAIRSAALNEDQGSSSQAGQFHTELAVTWEGISDALWKVVQIGVMRLKGRPELFSCFIQVYQEADLAGVTFTRGPEGDPRLFIEYHFGRGEALVSGSIQPLTLNRFWGDDRPFLLSTVRETEELLFAWKHLEEYFGHPQDIEWCVVRGEWFLLQARPITTLSSEVYQGLLEADAVLPAKQPFFYEQTEIAELAPHPSQLTLSLLERLYREDGPIVRAYTSIGVIYDPRDFFSLVAGQLYVDREEELKTLLSSFTLLDPKSPGIPQKQSLLAPLQRMKLQRALSSSRVPAPIQLGRLTEALTRSPEARTVTEWQNAFLKIYEDIFLTNLATQQELSRLETVLARTTLSSVSVLSSQIASAYRLDLSLPRTHLHQAWQGNGLDIADSSLFIARRDQEVKRSENETDVWWKQLSSLSRTAFEPVIRAAVQADQLREVGRWVTVCWMNHLRELIKEQCSLAGLSEEEAYQVRLEEWEEAMMPTREEIRARLEAYRRSAEYRLPSRLTNLPMQETQTQRGLSAGTAKGMLVLVDELSHRTEQESVILLTEQLRPELAPLLSRVKGVITARGGMLSHLAILAREQGIPVVSGVDFSELVSRSGQEVQIDGAKGTIEFNSMN